MRFSFRRASIVLIIIWGNLRCKEETTRQQEQYEEVECNHYRPPPISRVDTARIATKMVTFDTGRKRKENI
jgi:hypothetical protein